MLFDVSEAALYQIDSDLRQLEAELEFTTVHCVIGNVVFKSELSHRISS